MMTGHGGWPMSMFLTPDGSAVLRRNLLSARRPARHAELPARARARGERSIARARSEVEEASKESAAARSRASCGRAARAVRSSVLRSTPRPRRIAANYDSVHGGFGGAPKFPPSMTLEFLMQVAWRSADDDGHAARDHRHHADEDGPRRDVRPGRRRLPPLLRRRPLARAALREDALRQRAPGAALHARLAVDEGPALRADRERDPRVGSRAR